MSLVTLIRDYVDVVNSSEQLDGYTLSSLAYYTFIFLFTLIKQALVYCFTFHWLRDLSYFCFTPPLTSYANFLGQLSSFGTSASSIGMGKYPLSSFASGLLTSKSNGIELVSQQPLSNLLAFSDSSFVTSIGVMFLGLFNGCFSCLHLSAANLVTIQRMLVQGVPAGLYSACGIAVGQCSFLMCVLFGFRGLLFPWLALEPLHFLLGTGILLSIASATAQDRRTPTVKWSDKSSLLIFAFTSFALAWCEQTAIFQWIGNTSFGTEPTFLESTPSFENIHTVFGNIQQLVLSLSYLFAFFLGNIVGTSFISVAVQRLIELVLRYRGIPIYYGLVKQANLPLATLVFAFGFGSLPYYGFDYLITKGLGFVPHERFFQQTLFSPTNLVSKTSQTKEPSQGRLEDQLALLFTLEDERSKSFAVDTTPFDDGQYLKTGQKRPQSLEDINYRGEHLWTNRLSRISNMREQANQTQSSFLGPVFSWMRSFLWGDGTAANITGVQTALTEQSNKTTNTHFLDAQHTLSSSPTDPTEETQSKGSFGLLPTDSSSASSLRNNGTGKQAVKDPNMNRTSETSAVHFNSSRPMVDNIKQRKEFSPEKEQIDNYVKEFDRQFDKGFSNFYNADPYSLIEVEDQWQEKRIKEKCYTNPIYTFLLNTEIDAFLTRQPNSHWLSPQEEVVLLKRRQLLSNYYDTLALTNQVSTSEALSQLVPKSYANAIYNHQFKGTLKVAHRLFSVKKAVAKEIPYSEKTLTGENTNFLVKRGDNETNPPIRNNNAFLEDFPLHTLRSYGSSESFAKGKPEKRVEYEKRRVIKFDQPLFLKETNNTKPILFHEELGTGKASKVSEDKQEAEKKKPNIFLLEQSEPLPLYASWDEQLRKLLVTNRFQSRALAGYTFSEFPINSKITTFFTTWPIPNPIFDKKNLTHTIANEIDNEKTIHSNSFLASQSFPSPTEEAEDREDPKESKKIPKLKKGKDIEAQQTTDPKLRNQSRTLTDPLKTRNAQSDSLVKPTDATLFFQKSIDSIAKSLFHQRPKNRFLFQTESVKKPLGVLTSEATQAKEDKQSNDMVNALLQWQKLIKENKQLSKEDKNAAKDKIIYWPENIHRSSWSNELIDNDIEFDEPTENVAKKQTLLWEFTPPNHGGFLWPGSNFIK